jgi:hypothetical protein
MHGGNKGANLRLDGPPLILSGEARRGLDRVGFFAIGWGAFARPALGDIAIAWLTDGETS